MTSIQYDHFLHLTNDLARAVEYISFFSFVFNVSASITFTFSLSPTRRISFVSKLLADYFEISNAANLNNLYRHDFFDSISSSD